ncbi:MAG: hypothetical protein ACFE96_11165, partial [Candidatus Hermodarchaeota archaeon]
IIIIQQFLDTVFSPLEKSFDIIFNLDTKGTKYIIEAGIKNILKQTLLSPEFIKQLDNKFSGFVPYHDEYVDFIENEFYDFKFGQIIEASVQKELSEQKEILKPALGRAVSIMIFNYLAQNHLDLKSTTQSEFIAKLKGLLMDIEYENLKFINIQKEIHNPSMISNLFLTLADNFMTTKDDYDLGEILGTIARNPNTFHGWITETKYLFTQHIEQLMPTLLDTKFNNKDSILWQWSERNPSYGRVKTEAFNLEILKNFIGKDLSEVRSIIHGFDTTEYVKLPYNARETDILAYLLAVNPSVLSSYIVHTTHVKGMKSTTQDLGAKYRAIS